MKLDKTQAFSDAQEGRDTSIQLVRPYFIKKGYLVMCEGEARTVMDFEPKQIFRSGEVHDSAWSFDTQILTDDDQWRRYDSGVFRPLLDHPLCDTLKAGRMVKIHTWSGDEKIVPLTSVYNMKKHLDEPGSLRFDTPGLLNIGAENNPCTKWAVLDKLKLG